MKSAVMSYYVNYKELAENAVRSFVYHNDHYDPYVIEIGRWIPTEKPKAILKLMNMGYSNIVCLGGDTFTISECHEFDIDTDLDVLGTLNIQTAIHLPVGCHYLKLKGDRKLDVSIFSDYLNTDVICIRNLQFCYDWRDLCMEDPMNRMEWDQDYINFLFYSKYYNTKVIDKNIVCMNETGREQWLQGKFTEIDNKIILNDGRQLKILHWAGGGNKSNYHIENSYLKTLPNALSIKTMDILNKSSNIPLFYL